MVAGNHDPDFVVQSFKRDGTNRACEVTSLPRFVLPLCPAVIWSSAVGECRWAWRPRIRPTREEQVPASDGATGLGRAVMAVTDAATGIQGPGETARCLGGHHRADKSRNDAGKLSRWCGHRR